MHVESDRPRLGQRLGRSYAALYNVNSVPSQLGHKRASKQKDMAIITKETVLQKFQPK